MKHYKAIICLHNRISSLQNEIEKLKKVTKDSPEFNGFVFIQNDIENIESEINELTTTMQFIIDLNKKSIKKEDSNQGKFQQKETFDMKLEFAKSKGFKNLAEAFAEMGKRNFEKEFKEIL